MIHYIAVKRTSERDMRGYDIVACDGGECVMEEISRVRNAVPDRDCAERVLAKLNSGDVDPVHMEDIIEDTLYEMTL